MLRRRLLQNNEAGGGSNLPYFLSLTLDADSNGSAWSRGSMAYSIELGFRLINNNWVTGFAHSFPQSYLSTYSSTVYLNPSGKSDFMPPLDRGYFTIEFTDEGGDLISPLQDRVSWSVRPGGHPVTSLVSTTKARINVEDIIPVSSSDKLICNPILLWDGELLASFYIYV